MATTNEKTKKTVTSSRTTGSSSASNISTPDIRIDRLDYVDLKDVWGRLSVKKRENSESNLLRITSRIKKLDTVAELALGKTSESFKYNEEDLRHYISSRGLATELHKVNKRINALRVGENKRLILSMVYPHILHSLLKRKDDNSAIEDDVGFTNDVLYELEKEGGALDVFSQELVKLIGEKHRINFTDDNVLRDLVADQVRAGL